MVQSIFPIVDFERHPLSSQTFQARCKRTLDENGVLVLERFLKPEAIRSIKIDGANNRHQAYFTTTSHNVFLSPHDPSFSADHPRNREMISSKGCITTDQIPKGSSLRTLYYALQFRKFLCSVFNLEELYEYADPLSSINLHYANEGQELGWHFDNSSFAVTLMIQIPKGGGAFQYVRDVRDADQGDMSYDELERIINNDIAPKTLSIGAGSLMLFRGRNSIHRVTPVKGNQTRIVVVLAYNTEYGISLSESARMTFYGRLG